MAGFKLAPGCIFQGDGGAQPVVAKLKPGEVLFGFVELPSFFDDDVQLLTCPLSN
jgi:hypothetical protein